MSGSPGDITSNWVFDYSLLEDIPVSGNDLLPLDSDFQWNPPPLDVLTSSATLSMQCDEYVENLDSLKESGSRKRTRLGTSATDSKAYKEKMRRDKLNDRFQELSCILEPGKLPKTDKSAILTDAMNMVIQLREEAQKLKESNDTLQEKVKELKVEKNEMKDEKMKLKADKEKLEQQVKALSSSPGFLPHLPPNPPPFAVPSQVIASKLVPLVGYPGIPMWQFMPPTAFDTSDDHSLRPPVA